MDVKEVKKDADHRMRRAVETIQQEFAKIRTGRATPTLLDGIKVSYYGSMVPLPFLNLV
jgi:ribosome recycling factor